VTQEALHNAVKYSGVSEYAVELTAMTDEIQLIVRDEGAGFDVEEARKTSGLGLVSMQERVHLVHGSLCVESELGAGTTVLAVIPLAPENQGRAEDTAVEETVNATGTV
jgi:signal transduction histidine kinase